MLVQSEPGTRSPEPELGVRRRGVVSDMLLLMALCFVAYFIGLTNHGLTNWQESQRALVAREMQQAGEWLVPTINHQPYLAKPPMFYWCQLALAKIFGHETGEFELRLTVALAGLAGVLATYLVVRQLLSAREHASDPPGLAREAALWSALFLATGTLYVHSSRIGELDILLAPFVVIAVGGIARAWQKWREDRRVGYGALAVATLAATAATLTKGPPALAVIAAAGYGPMLVQAVLAAPRRDGGFMRGFIRRLPVSLAAVAAALLTFPKAHSFGDWVGALMIVVMCAGVGEILGRVLTPPALGASARVLARTHPIAVLGLPLLALWGWWKLVSDRIGAGAAAFWAQKETDDNLNILVAESPIKNLEAMAYGAGLGSLAAIGAIVWLIVRRPKLSAAWLVPVAWVGFGFAIFSLLGKGIGRYLTPVWPGVAMLGGIWVATVLARDRNARRVRMVLGSAVVAIACVSGWWYGFGRERYTPCRSPRALMADLLERGVDPSRLASFELRTSALDYYARHRVEPVGDIQLNDVTAGGKPWTLEELRDDVAAHGERVVFVRVSQPRDPKRDPRPAVERIREAGMEVSVIDSTPEFRFDSGKSPVVAARVRARKP